MAGFKYLLAGHSRSLHCGGINGWRLNYVLERGSVAETLILPNGTDLLGLPGTLHLTEYAHGGLVDAIGNLSYITHDKILKPAPNDPQEAGFSINCRIPARELQDLIRSEEGGVGPAAVIVDIPYEMVGFDREWDETVFRWKSTGDTVRVTDLQFIF